MDRITGAWDGLGRRERALAIAAVAVLVLVLLAFLLFGGSEPVTPVDASTSSVADAAARAEGDAPAMVVAADGSTTSATTSSTIAATEGQGVAALNVSGSGGGDAIDPQDDPLVDAANEHYEEEKYSEGAYEEPVVSEAVKAAGRDLERVAKAYTECMAKAAAANADSRHCINDSLKYGVEISSGGLHRNASLTIAKRSSDGHTLHLTFTDDGMCRSLDEGRSCTGWTT